MTYLLTKPIAVLVTLILLVGGGYVAFLASMNTSGVAPTLNGVFAHIGGNENADWVSTLQSFTNNVSGSGAESEMLANASAAPDLTEDAAQRLATKYLDLKAVAPDVPLSAFGNIAVNDASIKTLSAAYLKEAPAYTTNDITLITNDAVGDRKNYLNNAGTILKESFPFAPRTSNAKLPDELAIVLRALETGDRAALVELNPYIRAYRNASSRLLTIASPASYRELHMRLINSFALSAYALESMQRFGSDGMTGTLGFNLYAAQIDSSHEILLLIKNAVAKDEFTFSQNEGGAYFDPYLKRL